MNLQLEQHFYATHEFRGIRRDPLSAGYRTVARSIGLDDSLCAGIDKIVEMGVPSASHMNALEQREAHQVTGLGCWALPGSPWVGISCARAFAREPGSARPWPFFVHTLLLSAQAYREQLGANPFVLWRQGLFAARPPEVETSSPRVLDTITFPVDGRNGHDDGAVLALTELQRLLGRKAGAELIRAAALRVQPVLVVADLLPDLDPGRDPQLRHPFEAIFRALPLAMRAELSFWAYRFATRKDQHEFDFLVVPPVVDVGDLPPGVMHRINARAVVSQVQGLQSVLHEPGAESAALPAAALPAAGRRFAESAAALFAAGEFQQLADMVAFIDGPPRLNGSRQFIDIGALAYPDWKQMEQDPALAHKLSLARKLCSDTSSAQAVRFAFERLCLGLEGRLQEAGEAGQLSEVMALLGLARPALGRAGNEAEVLKFCAAHCEESFKLLPAQPWQPEFLEAAVKEGLVDAEVCARWIKPWLSAMPPDLGSQAGDLLHPLYRVAQNARLHAGLAGLLLREAARLGMRDQPTRELLALWSTSCSREERRTSEFLLLALKLDCPDLFWKALQDLLAVRPLNTEDLASMKGGPSDLPKQLLNCFQVALKGLTTAFAAGPSQLRLNLLQSMTRLGDTLPPGEATLEVLRRLGERFPDTPLPPGAQTDKRRGEFFVSAFNAAIQFASRADPAMAPRFDAMALELCERATLEWPDAETYAWPLEGIWNRVAQVPETRCRIFRAACRLKRPYIREALGKFMSSGDPIPQEIAMAFAEYLRANPKNASHDLFGALVDLSKKKPLEAWTPHAKTLIRQWTEEFPDPHPALDLPAEGAAPLPHEPQPAGEAPVAGDEPVPAPPAGGAPMVPPEPGTPAKQKPVARTPLPKWLWPAIGLFVGLVIGTVAGCAVRDSQRLRPGFDPRVGGQPQGLPGAPLQRTSSTMGTQGVPETPSPGAKR